MNTTTTVNYKYHIYELVDGKWKVHDTWELKSARERHYNYMQKSNAYKGRTFKLVTEKITTVREFEEDVAAPKPISSAYVPAETNHCRQVPECTCGECHRGGWGSWG